MSWLIPVPCPLAVCVVSGLTTAGSGGQFGYSSMVKCWFEQLYSIAHLLLSCLCEWEEVWAQAVFGHVWIDSLEHDRQSVFCGDLLAFMNLLPLLPLLALLPLPSSPSSPSSPFFLSCVILPMATLIVFRLSHVNLQSYFIRSLHLLHSQVKHYLCQHWLAVVRWTPLRRTVSW